MSEWVEFAAPRLGLDPAEVPLNDLLGMTGIVAHGVVRPAAPVSSYLLGLAVGRGLLTNEEGDARLRELVREWASERESIAAGSADADGGADAEGGLDA
ncbi:hypothetical protein C7K25_13410 [Gulosibacter molinativorax]|uniref:DUF6457 domain-containing protein n=1 Tax=Gulosibacter molinativorax TaxID=256821 RepID=A0ABT7CAZ1_9MICO|nr:hypothetical protein [Gulosibacter molinativorax]